MDMSEIKQVFQNGETDITTFRLARSKSLLAVLQQAKAQQAERIRQQEDLRRQRERVRWSAD